MGENSPEWIAAFFGCLLHGVLAVPLDAAGSASFAERVIAVTAPRLIVGDAALLASLRAEVPRMDLSRSAAEQGAGEAARDGGRWFRPSGLAVCVGRPLRFAADASPEAITRQLEDCVAGAEAELMPR